MHSNKKHAFVTTLLISFIQNWEGLQSDKKKKHFIARTQTSGGTGFDTLILETYYLKKSSHL